MKKLNSVLIVLLILGIVGIAGCTSSDNTTYTQPDNYSNSNPEPVQTTNTEDTNTEEKVTDTSSSNSNPSSSSTQTYVGSVNSDVFHYPWCYHVDQIKSYNKITFSSRDDAVNSGYRPCKDCNP